MVHISGHVRIAAPPEQVFDTLADSRNEPRSTPLAGAPEGWLRAVGPLAGLLGGRMEHKIWTRLKQQLETGPSS